MATLKSDHFTTLRGDLDKPTSDKLEKCANADPSPVQSHFSVKDNSRGEPIRKLQEALVAIQKKDLKLKLRTFSVTGIYDGNFANAVEDYKRARNIKNHAGVIDNVIGVKTIIAMDGELPSSPPDKPADTRKKVDIVLRLEGNRVEARMTGPQVLPSGRHLQVYSPVPPFDKILLNPTTDRFLLLDGWFLHDTDAKAKGMLSQSLMLVKGLAGDLGARIDRVYFYGSSAGGRSVLDFAGFAKNTLGKLTMIGVADAHFTQDDTKDKPTGNADAAGFIARPENIPAFSNFAGTETAPPGNRFNWFQIAGNHGQKKLGVGEPFFTSNFDGEIHGSVNGYFNFPALQVSAGAERDDVRAHEEACTRGLVLMEAKIVNNLMTG